MAGRPHGAEGFTLLEVMLASALFSILIAALSGAIIYLTRLNTALSERARLESAASMALAQMVQGTPERPGLLAARTLFVDEPHKLKFQTEASGSVYEYSVNNSGQLTFSVDGSNPLTLLDGVKSLTVVQERLPAGYLRVGITMVVSLPLPQGATEWTLTAEAVPRNAQ